MSWPAPIPDPSSGPVVHYPEEILDSNDDDGTMVESLELLRSAVVGHRIVSAETGPLSPGSSWSANSGLILTLDNGTRVEVADTHDCCAGTTLEKFLLHPESVDHMILGVGTTGEYTTWHIYADYGDVMRLEVDWTCGNPFYYGYGFDITVKEPS